MPESPVAAPAEPAVASVDDADWATAVDAALRDPDQPRLVFQPIVDLRRGVVAGYEALARFPGPPAAPPDAWFAAADRLGVGARLEARVVRAAIAALAGLPADCFLTVNVSPHLLCEPELAAAFTDAPDLRRLVIELTEHVQVDDYEPLLALLDVARGRGAVVALDDAGTGYSGLQQVALIRSEMVKIDRALVDHADQDEVKLAVTELLGAFAGRLDAVLIAEGVERTEELEAFVRLGVPLAQGWLFGRPADTWTTLPTARTEEILLLAGRSTRADSVAGLVERTPTVTDEELLAVGARAAGSPDTELVAVLDRHGRAVCVLRRGPVDGEGRRATDVLPVSLRAADTADVADVAARAMTRPAATRFDPVVCGDAYGRYVGLVRPERLMLRLADLATRSVRIDHGPEAARVPRPNPPP